MDADSFFASCEVSRNPKYKGKPVVVGGSDRGIAVAVSQEAKKRGIFRGMTMRDMKAVCKNVIALPVDLRLYGLYSSSIFSVVDNFVNVLEKYSIDECFGEMTVKNFNEAEIIAYKIKEEIKKKLDITVSIGISTTKVLAKIGSKRNKPDGVCVLPFNSPLFVAMSKDTSVGKVWGIGGKTTVMLGKMGISTVADLISLDRKWIISNFDKPLRMIWQELSGISVMNVSSEDILQKSIQKTRTFKPATSDRATLISKLSINMERAFARARRLGVCPKAIHFMLKTSEFRYERKTVIFEENISNQSIAEKEIAKAVDELKKDGILYRSTGVTLSMLSPFDIQHDLFSKHEENSRYFSMWQAIDDLSHKYGHSVVAYGTSLKKETQNLSSGISAMIAIRSNDIKRLGIPFAGEVV